MKFELIHSQLEEHLVLIFAGWGMDSRPFMALVPRGYDVAVVWDYRDLSDDWIKEIGRYSEIAVVAWSFGVVAAASFLSSHPSLPVTATIAVNGTQHPVDDTLGIPHDIFNGTLVSLSDRNLIRFHRRMCGGEKLYSQFVQRAPRRHIDGLRDELQSIGARRVVPIMWDKAIISTGDLIIPPAAQRSAWQEEAHVVTEIPGPHLPDFEKLLSVLLTDKRLVESKFGSVNETYDTHATVQRYITDTLLSRVNRGGRILEIGSGTGQATAILAQAGDTEVWDLAISPRVAKLAAEGRVKAVACDAETAIRNLPSASVDTVFSASTVQWFNSLPAFLREVRRVLAPGGRAVISTFGPRTMEQIHSLIGTAPLYPSSSAVRRMVPEATVSEEIITLEFDSPRDVLDHIRLTGVNSLGPAISPALTRRLLSAYPADGDGKYCLTYQPVYIIIDKPH